MNYRFLQSHSIRQKFFSLIAFLLCVLFLLSSCGLTTDENAPTEKQNSISSIEKESSSKSAHDSSSSEKDKSQSSSSENTTQQFVWITSTGSKYHSKSTCSNMKNPQKIDKDKAIEEGYTPCKKCY